MINTKTIINTANLTNTDKNVSKREKLLKVSKEFESVFFTEMFQIMFKNEEDSNEKSIYKSMLVTEYGKMAGQKLGLAEKITSSMLKMQEV